MGTCDQCIWWGRTEQDGDDLIAGDYPSDGVQHGFGASWQLLPCMNPKVGGGGYNSPDHKAPDSATSYSQIATGPCFGCVHWTNKANDQA